MPRACGGPHRVRLSQRSAFQVYEPHFGSVKNPRSPDGAAGARARELQHGNGSARRWDGLIQSLSTQRENGLTSVVRHCRPCVSSNRGVRKTPDGAFIRRKPDNCGRSRASAKSGSVRHLWRAGQAALPTFSSSPPQFVVRWDSHEAVKSPAGSTRDERFTAVTVDFPTAGCN